MKSKLTFKVCLLMIFFNMHVVINSFALDIPPLVYDVENTGVDCTKPPFPTIADLPIVEPLTDPFEWSDGSGRDTTFASWTRRRAEIGEEIKNYEIGPKPIDMDTILASYSAGKLTVKVVKNDDTLVLTSNITLPAGTGPFPAIIGMGGGSGSLSSSIFTSRNIALIPFNFGEVTAHTQSRGNEPINKLYPDLAYMGSYSAWSWGVSRLIDGLEIVKDSLPIDLKHLGVTGCSFAGKMALFAGAFDERIALTIPQESGGGGAAAWRVSQTLPGVENLSSTNSSWFMTSMFQFGGDNVSKLPHDHHELMAMIAPRALFVIGNPDMVWLAEESGYTSCVAAKRVWENFGIADRMGYSFYRHVDHCGLPAEQQPEVEAFIEKFLLDNDTVNTDIARHVYNYVIPTYWTDWWGKEEAAFPILDRTGNEEVWLEAECANVGAAWNVVLDTLASNGSYVVQKSTLVSTKVADTNSGALLTFPFTVNKDTTYYLYGRINFAVPNNDTYWFKLDDGSFKFIQAFSKGWEWQKFTSFDLKAGEHTITLSYREKDTKLDKICISSFSYVPKELGDTAEFVCVPDTTTKFYSSIGQINEIGSYSLGQNYPNPLKYKTNITFEIPRNTYVSLKVYNMLGEEITELAGKEYIAGIHTVEFDPKNLSSGIYFYSLKADKYIANRKMIIQTR